MLGSVQGHAVSRLYFLLLGRPPFLVPFLGFQPRAFRHVSRLDPRAPDVLIFFASPVSVSMAVNREREEGRVSDRRERET